MKEAENKPQRHLIYSTLAQAASQIGVPKAVLRAAKNRGAPGFVGYRIDWTLLEPWFKEHKDELEGVAEETLLHWKTKKEKHMANLAEIQEEEARGKYLMKEQVHAQVQAIALAQKNLLKSKLTQELPSRLLGMNTVEMSIEMDKVLQEICKLMSDLKV